MDLADNLQDGQRREHLVFLLTRNEHLMYNANKKNTQDCVFYATPLMTAISENDNYLITRLLEKRQCSSTGSQLRHGPYDGQLPHGRQTLVRPRR